MPIQTRYLYLLKYILPITDVLMLNIVYISAYYFTAYLGKGLNEELQRHYLVVCNLLWLFNTAVFGLYSEYNARKIERIYRGTIKSLLLHFVLFSRSFYHLLSFVSMVAHYVWSSLGQNLIPSQVLLLELRNLGPLVNCCPFLCQ